MNGTVLKVVKLLAGITAFILALVPLQAFLTVSFSSLVGHYTLIRLWEEFLLAILSLGSLYLLYVDKGLRRKFFGSRLNQLIICYVVLTLIWGAAAYDLHKVTPKALGYGWIVNLRYLIFFMTTLLVASKSNILKRIWPLLLLIPAVVVVFFGIVQRVFLPYDFLRHFGYNKSTIFPYEDINNNVNYPRIMSTLRGSNPLGAYLVVVLSAVAVLFKKIKNIRGLMALFFATASVALIFTYSRGAWAGALVSLLFLSWIILPGQRTQRMVVAILAVCVIIGGLLAVGLRHNATFQNIFFHTESGSVIKTTSDQGHASALRNGMNDLIHEPLGRGPGTAGPASAYNNNQPRIAENYYIQIGQEVGWLGLILFLAIYYLIAHKLWQRRTETLALILLISLVGISLVNLVSHAWTDDTLSYLWWGLAGIALSSKATSKNENATA